MEKTVSMEHKTPLSLPVAFIIASLTLHYCISAEKQGKFKAGVSE